MDELLGKRQGLLLRRLGGNDARLAMGVLAVARRIDDSYNELLAEHDLSGGRFAALLAISETRGITPARLSEELEVKRATVTGLVDGLVKRGLVVRGGDEADRRVQTLTATSDGERRVQVVLPLVEQWLGGLISGVDRETAWPLLSRIHRNLGSNGDS
ncbi:MarR family transcriptional regulator [Amycolatopsis sp. NPDC004079]|uniref:MarR family winged helix-turn-helix transcriptional regulator n=1 Tax=Amycolatopsis sp. NPDC004079 TaxID=3154549 RepID=UPI0033B45B1E